MEHYSQKRQLPWHYGDDFVQINVEIVKVFFVQNNNIFLYCTFVQQIE